MKQLAYERERRSAWQRFGASLERLEGGRRGATDADSVERFVADYRDLCRDLAVARTRGYGSVLLDELNALVVRGHNVLYTRRSGFAARAVSFVAADFPRQVRHDARFVWVALAAFLIPLALVAWAVSVERDVLYSVMSDEQVRGMESMYRPDAAHFGRERQAASDFRMFGHYIANNISIAFQLFATGIALGVGTLFYLVYNGVVIGAVSSHLIGIGYAGTFLPFVAGHGAFELTAIVLAGAAGLKLGYALLAPGGLTRAAALRQAAAEAATIVLGAALMLLVAAFIEAYWSSSRLPGNTIKYGVALLLWSAVIAYLTFSGRRRGP